LTASVVIPARYGSTRFPGKIVASETGMPLVQHVVMQARKCKHVRDVIVAADDDRIRRALQPFGTGVVMTSPKHQSGTDRIAEVAKDLKDEIVVNVQGDEPEIDPNTIDALIERLQGKGDDMATAATAFPAHVDPEDPNLVKVAISPFGHAIYFSRAAIPYQRDETERRLEPYYLHLGIYAYRRDFLLRYANWPPTPIEMTEKLEQLRALEHARSIFVLKVNRATHGIDTPDQYEEFVERYHRQSRLTI
jgi:3-deoxy-manno-octulosonate cytidylyltransferase (CMP-KDO synthetase)